MPIRALDHDSGTFLHECRNCGQRASLSLDPRQGDLAVWDSMLVVGPCPTCRDQHGLFVFESLRRDIPAWEALEGRHPQSLEGARLRGAPLSHPSEVRFVENIVTQHHIGHSANPEHVEQAQLIRAMQRHPLLAAHAPLRDDPSAETITSISRADAPPTAN